MKAEVDKYEGICALKYVWAWLATLIERSSFPYGTPKGSCACINVLSIVHSCGPLDELIQSLIAHAVLAHAHLVASGTTTANVFWY